MSRLRLALLIACLPTAAYAGPITMKGKVLDRDGRPLEAAEVSTMWNSGDGVKDLATRKQAGFGAVRTAADGGFAIRIPNPGKTSTMMAISADRSLGGVAVVPEGQADFEIRALPLAKVHGRVGSKEMLGRPAWSNVYVEIAPDGARLLQCPSRLSEFTFLLPPGEYTLVAYGADLVQARIPLSLRPDRTDVDLGQLDLPATFFGKHIGKELPPWSTAAARGVKPGATLADFQGKWVLVDFWGHWCAPCVQQLGQLIDFYEDHQADRDKFEVVAFHDSSVHDLEEMDARTGGAKKSAWAGRDLPFPILLDAEDGATVEAYGITSFPTTLLFDPEGKLVGESSMADLETHLPPVKSSRRVARACDRQLAIGLKDGDLAANLAFFADMAGVPIRLDEGAVKASGVALDSPSRLTMRGSVTLRSWLELQLDGFRLRATPKEGELVVAPSRPDEGREDSEIQKECAERIEARLALGAAFDLKDVPLEDVAAHFQEETKENFVLDPAGLMNGSIDPKAKVSGSSNGVPLRAALTDLLKPLGLVPVVRSEVVVLAKP